VDRSANENFKFNQETEFIPILGLIESQLNSPPPATSNSSNASSIQENHHPELLALLASELSVSPEEIYDLDLYA
jgi:aspartyl aminopeptidase